MSHSVRNIVVAAFVALMLFALRAGAGEAPAANATGGRNLKVAVLQLYHESNVFLPNETTLQDFIFPGSPMRGEEMLNEPEQDEVTGFVKAAREFGVELVGIESPREPKTGMGSGWVQRAAFDHLVGRMLDDLKNKGPFDGVYMALHGAMSVRGIERTEAELARRVRAVVGPKVPIAATFDPHGNEDQEFFKWADLAFAYKYYPHYDAHLQGERAARMLVRMMRDSYRPAVAVRKPPILTPDVNQWTGVSPWMDLVQRALMWEGRSPDTFVNVFFGFPWADVPDVGMCIEVMTNGDRKLADEIADDMASFAWRNRVELMNVTRIHGMDEAMQALDRATKAGELPVVLGDYSDRSGNAVWILREVVERDLSNALFATIRDPRALEQLKSAGEKPGSDVDLMVGGYWDPSAGSPVRIRGRLLYLGPGIAKPHETWAAVGFGRGNVVWLSPNLEQIIEPARLRFGGLDPARFDIFVLKSRVHFRRGFMDSGFAKTALLVEPPGRPLGTVHLDALPYENVKLDRYFPWGHPKER